MQAFTIFMEIVEKIKQLSLDKSLQNILCFPTRMNPLKIFRTRSDKFPSKLKNIPINQYLVSLAVCMYIIFFKF